jgi:hypothetical protein
VPSRRAFIPLILLPACTRPSAWQPLPPQRPDPSGPDPVSHPFFIYFNSPAADAHVLSGIATGPGSGYRRWTADNFALQFNTLPAGPWLVRLRFEIIQRFIAELGPFTVSVSVNRRPVASQYYDEHGDLELSASVPPSLLTPGAAARIDVSCDRVWVSPIDGARLSLRLIAAGFIKP